MMTRQEAIALAKETFKQNPPKGHEGSTLVDFEPAEWLIEALLRASMIAWIDASQALMKAGSALCEQAMVTQHKIVRARHKPVETASVQ